MEMEDEMDEDGVQVLLCDEGPGGGGMAYYLGPAFKGGTGSSMGSDAQAGAIVLVGDNMAWQRPNSRAEILAQDESVEDILARLEIAMDQAEMAETPWRQLGANMQDYFNFDLDEKQFKEYLMKQCRLRLEARQRRKILVNSHSL